MTPTQKIQVRMSELRQKINDMTEIRNDDADKLAERQKLADELKAQEIELRAAIKAEDDDDDTTPETREWAELNGKFDLGEVFTNVTEHRASDGAIAEVQKEPAWARTTYPLRCSWRNGPSRLRPPTLAGLRPRSRASCSLSPSRLSCRFRARSCRSATRPFRS